MEEKNEKGQALLELIIFLPLMFTVYALVTGFANAIYGSINQQKATRAYFYYRVQNNSTIPRRPPDDAKWTKYSIYYVGWRIKTESEVPFLPCYKVSIPLAEAEDSGGCDSQYTVTADSAPSTQFMRVGTVYGFCGATYVRAGDIIFSAPNRSDLGYQTVIDQNSCVILE